ncbi:hypothetical protein GBAR_LOCUS28861 [Geodia barretti]|jgi:hypothetical protein|uniref:Uncharacterized protein n=1 Tax=Geodia barretti TaxID=519541 RepID=A0AA35TRC7_GEOBA|nr:hypothetical protein GBAR_LOCUS28861 [Geodia barretti]
MPAIPSDLLASQYVVQSIEDPDTGAPCEYRILEDTDYELCAVFAAESPKREPSDARSRNPSGTTGRG